MSKDRVSMKDAKKANGTLLHWWYLLTSPPEPDGAAPLHERELFRRGRTGSQISIFLFVLLLLSYPAAFAGSNSLLIFVVTINLVSLVFAMVLNRFKYVTLAGIIVVLGVVTGPTTNILTTPGGVNVSALPIFCFLVLPLMCAVSFLSPEWVFIVAAINSFFTVLVLRFLPSTGELYIVLGSSFPGIVTPILLSQWIVAIVAYLWVRGAKIAIKRADRAEEIIKLQQEINRYIVEKAEQRKQLEQSIHLIEIVHAQIANGNLSARVPLDKRNTLWSISGQLNNLLARYQQLYMQSHQFSQSQVAQEQVLQENAKLKMLLRQSLEEKEQRQHTLYPNNSTSLEKKGR